MKKLWKRFIHWLRTWNPKWFSNPFFSLSLTMEDTIKAWNIDQDMLDAIRYAFEMLSRSYGVPKHLIYGEKGVKDD